MPDPNENLYRSKPTEVEAIQWRGSNVAEVSHFTGGFKVHLRSSQRKLLLFAGQDGAQKWVPVPVGHWIVRKPGDPTDYWPVDPDYFAEKYEPIGVPDA